MRRTKASHRKDLSERLLVGSTPGLSMKVKYPQAIDEALEDRPRPLDFWGLESPASHFNGASPRLPAELPGQLQDELAPQREKLPLAVERQLSKLHDLGLQHAPQGI